MANKPRTYDIKQYTEKARAALKIMEEKQKPNTKEKGSKSDVILAVKEEIKAMMEKGYTAQQIADAFKNNDVFGILPKSITELIMAKKRIVNKAGIGKPSKTLDKPVTNTSAGTKQKSREDTAGSFAVKPDHEDI